MQQNNTRKRTRKIIWFNRPFRLNVTTVVAKMFLHLLNTHVPPTNKLHKIFNRNTVKVSYSCNQNISQIIKGHNKKVTLIKRHHKLECNCRIETECPLNGDCRKEDVIYKCTMLTTFQPQKMYLGLAEGEFKSKEIIARPNHFETKLFEQYNSL